MGAPQRDQKSDYMRYSTVGIEFALNLVIFAWLGSLLDDCLGIKDHFPLFLIAGVFFGMGLGIWRLNRSLGSKSDKSDK